MRKVIELFVCVCIALLSLSGCQQKGGVQVESFSVVGVSPQGMRNIHVSVEADVANHGPAFKLSEISATLLLDGEPVVDLTCPDTKIERHSTRTYPLEVDCALSRQFNMFNLMSILQARDLKSFTVDLNARITDFLGVRHKFARKGIPLEEIVSTYDK